MSGSSKTLKRLGIAGLSAVTAVGVTPFLGVVAANAVPAAPECSTSTSANICLISPQSATASTLNDGTNNTVKLAAVITEQQPTSTNPAGFPSGDGVQFSYTTTTNGVTSSPTVIATDYTAPYNTEWAPPTSAPPTAYTVYATIVTSSGVADAGTYGGSASKTITVSNQYSSVHITSPNDETTSGEPQIGESGSLTSGTGTITVTGTRSADLPEITVTAATRDQATGATGAPGAGASTTTTPATVSYSKSNPQQWTATVTVPACANTTDACEVILDAVAAPSASAVSGSDEGAVATLYQRGFTGGSSSASFTVTPASANVATNTPVTYTVTAKDQNGQPFSGLRVTVCETPTTSNATLSATADNSGGADETTGAKYPCNSAADTQATDAAYLQLVTGPDGTAQFQAQDPTAETTSFQVQSEINGTNYVSTTDYRKTATLTTYTASASSLTFTVTPNKPIYASQTEYTDGTGSAAAAGAEQPLVELCVKDQNNNNTAASSYNTNNLVVQYTRTIYTPATSGTGYTSTTAPAATATIYPEPPNNSDGTANPNANCYYVSHPAAPTGDTYGNDVYTAYYNNDGVPGYQAGNGDIQASSVTLKFAELTIPSATNVAGQKGTNVSGSFKVVGNDGTPFANRTLSLSFTDTGDNNTQSFSPAANQPTGTTPANNSSPQTATCTTDAQGNCAYSVTDPDNDSVTVQIDDNLTLPANSAHPNQIATNVTQTQTVVFENSAPTLASVTNSSEYTEFPNGDEQEDFPGEPGTVMVVTDYFQDAQGNGYSGPVTITTNHGFFVETTKSGADMYDTSNYAPTATQGGNEGVTNAGGPDISNNGQTFTGTVDGGYLTFALGIGRDAAFDTDGRIVDTLTFKTASGSTYTQTNPESDPTGSTGTVAPDCGSTSDGYCGYIYQNQYSFTWSTRQSDFVRSYGYYYNYSYYYNNNSKPYCYTGCGTQDEQALVPLNGTSITFVPASSSDSTSGTRSSSQGADTVLLHLTDQFGNLVKEDGTNTPSNTPTLTVSGPATLSETKNPGSYTGTASGDRDPITVTPNGDASSSSTPITVTATWNAPSNTFNGNTSGSGSNTTTTYNDQQSTKQLTTSFTLNYYSVDFSKLQATIAATPSSVVATGNLVTDTVTVKDQNGNPVTGQSVTFHRTGPGTADVTTTVPTDQNGQASISFTSAATGNAAVNAQVKDSSGNLLASTGNVVGFDGTPTMNEVASRRGAGTVAITGVTRPGALVQLFQEPYGATSYTYYNGGQERADGNGNYAFYPTISKETSFRVLIDPTAGDYSGNSAVVTGPHRTTTVAVLPTMTLRSLKKGTVVAYIHYSPSLNSGAKTVIDLLTSHGYVYKATTYGTTVTFAATPGRTQQFVAFTTSNVAGVLNGQSQTYTIRIHS